MRCTEAPRSSPQTPPSKPMTKNSRPRKAPLRTYGFGRLQLRPRNWVVVGIVLLVVISTFQNSPKNNFFEPFSSSQDSASSKPTNTVRSIRVDAGIVPNVVGFSAIEAYSALTKQKQDVLLTGEDGKTIYVTGQKDLSALSGLFVCSQDHLAGMSINTAKNLELELSSECAGISNPMLGGQYATAAGVWAPAPMSAEKWYNNATVDGWVFGYNDRYYATQVDVMTSYGLITAELDLIKPVTDWCYDDNRSGENDLSNRALGMRDELAAAGTPVRLVMSKPQGANKVFMHRLSDSGAVRDGTPPVDSVNELLVKSGYWIPSIMGVDDSDYKVTPRSRTWKTTYSVAGSLSPLQESYKTRIVDAANAARTQNVGPLGACLDDQTSYWDRVYAKYAQSNERNNSGGAGAGTSGGTTDSGGAGASSGGSSGKCYVNGYIRNGRWVNGYWRRC